MANHKVINIETGETVEEVAGGGNPYEKRSVFSINGKWYLKVAQIYRTEDIPSGGYSEHYEIRVVETAKAIAAVMADRYREAVTEIE